MLQKYRLTFLHSSIFRTNFHCLKIFFFPQKIFSYPKVVRKQFLIRKGYFVVVATLRFGREQPRDSSVKTFAEWRMCLPPTDQGHGGDDLHEGEDEDEDV